MYCLVILDELDCISLYKIGENVKLYDSKEAAQIEIEEMKQKEKELFGNVITRYEVARYKE